METQQYVVNAEKHEEKNSCRQIIGMLTSPTGSLNTNGRRETFTVAMKQLTGMTVSDYHLNLGVGQNDPPVSPS